jgi:hypothetical protein
MGKTVPSFRIALDTEIGSWRSFRKALKKGDRRAFDRLMGMSRSHASAGGNALRTSPLDSMIMSILIEQQKAISRLRRELDGLRMELERL